ncbi:Protoporphyrinogen oxidase [Ralstonia mannitolilytica]|uniref:NAD(P)-binding protein n=1 Tax=Ralstonia mannitolilytica TaxID=105219 RepID=UPI000DFAFA16|nr:NAD(P)-binding protein [Ralstonia mannitolilytica]SUE24466.1 Protoporphyrinogen oxidase [Ralstonia mannitolilytica]
MATRRSFLVGAAAAGVAAAGAGSWAGFRAFTEITPNVRMPGQAAGHRLRGLRALPTPSETRRVGVAICGSGIGGLSCAWRLAKSGRRDAVVVEGPERYGNAAGGAFGTQRFPTGAHYLPLPSMESTHVREMLADFGVIERDPFALRPTYDERVLVHAPDERLWLGNRWQDGFVPREGIPEAERAEHTRFFAHIDRLRQTIGADGRRVFVVPTALSSADPAWRALDALTFRDWLHREGYRAATLHWYADYCCRDDYGVTADHVSAWAGIAYFASRGGMASNAEQGTVLTWPEGLDWMAERLFEAAGLNEPGRLLPGSVARIGTRTEAGARVFADVLQADGRVVRLLADHVVSAMPLHVAKHIVDGFDVPAAELPETAPWLLANLLIDGFPPEHDDTPLAWDNVVYRGTGLGYVVANHQDIRVGPPAQSVFTAYVALSDMTPKAAREWLLKASPQALLDRALADLDTVYGIRLRTQIRRADLTLRGHAMAIPTPGFLSRPGIARLRESAGPIHYAHADLSGYSVFEEAAWWGDRAARRILGG